jgi:hypothetical protein
MAARKADSDSRPRQIVSLKYAINHVFLPPKTPQEDDTSIPEEHNLIGLLLESTRQFSQECSTPESQQLQLVIRMLERLLKLKPGLDSNDKGAAMKKVIRELSNGGMYCIHLHLGLCTSCFNVIVQAPSADNEFLQKLLCSTSEPRMRPFS